MGIWKERSSYFGHVFLKCLLSQFHLIKIINNQTYIYFITFGFVYCLQICFIVKNFGLWFLALYLDFFVSLFLVKCYIYNLIFVLFYNLFFFFQIVSFCASIISVVMYEIKNYLQILTFTIQVRLSFSHYINFFFYHYYTEQVTLKYKKIVYW